MAQPSEGRIGPNTATAPAGIDTNVPSARPSGLRPALTMGLATVPPVVFTIKTRFSGAAGKSTKSLVAAGETIVNVVRCIGYAPWSTSVVACCVAMR